VKTDRRPSFGSEFFAPAMHRCQVKRRPEAGAKQSREEATKAADPDFPDKA